MLWESTRTFRLRNITILFKYHSGVHFIFTGLICKATINLIYGGLIIPVINAEGGTLLKLLPKLGIEYWHLLNEDQCNNCSTK